MISISLSGWAQFWYNIFIFSKWLKFLLQGGQRPVYVCVCVCVCGSFETKLWTDNDEANEDSSAASLLVFSAEFVEFDREMA